MGFLRNVVASLENPNRPLNDPDAWSEVFESSRTKSGIRVSMKKALGFPPLLRGINKISTDIGKLRIHVKPRTDDGGAERDRKHPAYGLLRRKPNRVMTSLTLKKTVQFHALWHGNGYIYVPRSRRGEPLPLRSPEGGLLILDPDPQRSYPVQADGQLWYVTHIAMRDARGQVTHDEPIRLRGEDVIHIRGLSLDGLLGLSTFDLVRESLGMVLATQEFAARFFGEGANVSGVLMVPGHLKTSAQENLLKAWGKMATGMSKAHKVAVVQDGTKFQPLSVDPEKAQMIGTQELSARQVANILGLPPHMLGDGTRTAYNSIEAENRNYLESSLDGWLCAWEEELEDKMLSEDQKAEDTHLIEFNRQQLLMMNLKDRSEAYRKLREIGGLTVNDLLRAESMPTIGPEGDERHIPHNWQPLTGAPAKKSSVSQNRNQQAMLSAHRELLRDRLQQLQQVEANGVERLAERRAADFTSAVDEFYEKHADRMSAALTPAVAATLTVLGRNDSAEALVHVITRNYTVQSRDAMREATLVDYANGGLETAVRDYTQQRLPERAAALVDSLMEGT